MSAPNTGICADQARYQRLRAAFILRGTTLAEWRRANGTHIQNVRDAYFGRWNGKGAQALIERVEKAASEAQRT